MQDIDEMAVRAAFRRVVSADEPPVGALVGEALRAGLRLRRRRRLQAAAGCAAVLAGLAAVAPPLAAALDGAAPARTPAGPGGPAGPAWPDGRGPGQRAHAPLPPGFHWVRPAVAAQIPAGQQVPVTARSAASLLLAVLPARRQVSSVAASLQPDGSVAANVNVDTGTVLVQMGRPGGLPLLGCGSARAGDGAIIGCRDYPLPGGTAVQELVLVAGLGSGNRVAQGYSYIFSATIRRVDGVSVMVRTVNYIPGPASLPPLTMGQVAAAAADPRWSWTMPGSFVARAQHLVLTVPGPRTCAQVQPADPRC